MGPPLSVHHAARRRTVTGSTGALLFALQTTAPRDGAFGCVSPYVSLLAADDSVSGTIHLGSVPERRAFLIRDESPQLGMDGPAARHPVESIPGIYASARDGREVVFT